MKLRTILAASALAVVAAPAAAWAQTPPIEGGTEVGGFVPSSLELILTQPKANLATFSRARTYTTSFDAMVTATEDTTLLTLADGDATSGSKLGHMTSAASPISVMSSTSGQSAEKCVQSLMTRAARPSRRAR